jgi:proline iminopeptidase
MMTSQHQLFPPIEPYHSGFLKVSALHTLYYEEAGNPHGQPILFLHGGPGGGLQPFYRQYFDPAFYRIILFDQRGCGRSTPYAELRENTTWDLVADIEKLRTLLGINRWIVFGGSWGSTLALSYAEKHPEPVVGLILRGIFLCRRLELLWFYQEGTSLLFPDAWEKFLEPIPPAERQDMMSAYYKRLTGPDPDARIKAARAWSIWEASTSHLYQDPDSIQFYEDPNVAIAFASIECHYFVNKTFFPSDNYLIEQAHRIRHIPTRIVQGRYDVVCPMTSAWELKKALPLSDLRIVPDAGHAIAEPGIRHELIQATEDFKALYK